MKWRILFIIFIGCWTGLTFGQDILVLNDGREIQCRIVSLSPETVNYKELSGDVSVVKSISLTSVLMILYENGSRETIPVAPSTYIDQSSITESKPEPKPEKEKPTSGYKGKYLMLGLGYGNSYGGAGLMAQLRIGGNVGVGFHAGAGYFPQAPVLAAGGIKFYPFRGIYIDAQFGLTGWETYYEYTWSSTSGASESFDGQLLFGPSALMGVEWAWGRHVGFGFNAALGGTYYLNVERFAPFAIAVDLGFVMRF